MSTVAAWDAWLQEQEGVSKTKPNVKTNGDNNLATPNDTKQTGNNQAEQSKTVAAVAPIDESSKKQLVELAVEVEKAKRTQAQNRKVSNRGRKKRRRGGEECFSESFEQLKRRILAQTIEPTTQPSDLQDQENGDMNEEAGTDPNETPKAKQKRQKRKAIAAKKQKLKMKGGASNTITTQTEGNSSDEEVHETVTKQADAA